MGSLIAYISIMESLLSAGVVRYYCKYKNENNQEKMENVLAISQRIYSFFALIVCVCGVVLIFVFKSVYSSSLTPFEMQESIIMLIFLIGKRVFINRGCKFYAGYAENDDKMIFLGKNVWIGMNTMFICASHDIGNSKQRAGKIVYKPIKIEEGCWI